MNERVVGPCAAFVVSRNGLPHTVFSANPPTATDALVNDLGQRRTDEPMAARQEVAETASTPG